MSISAKNTAPDEDDFADIEFRPRPAAQKDKPAEEKPAEDKPAEAQPDDTDAADKTPAHEPETKPADEKKPEENSYHQSCYLSPYCWIRSFNHSVL